MLNNEEDTSKSKLKKKIFHTILNYINLFQSLIASQISISMVLVTHCCFF